MSQSRAYQIRTDVMQESKSCALPLGEYPIKILNFDKILETGYDFSHTELDITGKLCQNM